MKIVINIPEEVVTAIQNGEDYKYDIHTAIAQGMPLPKEYVRWVDKLALDSDGNVRNFEGNIIGHYGSIDIGGHTINTGTFSYPLKGEEE